MLIQTETGAVLDLGDASSLHIICSHSHSPKGELIALVPDQAYDYCGLAIEDMRHELHEEQITLSYPVPIAEDILRDLQAELRRGADRFDLSNAVRRAFHQFHHARSAARRAWWSLGVTHEENPLTALTG